MKKLKYILSQFAILASLSACDSSNMSVQHSDQYDEITFTVETQKVENQKAKSQNAETRANEYEKYDPTLHPGQMGVWGYHYVTKQLGDAGTSIFNNLLVSYDSSQNAWGYSDPKKWEDFTDARHFDFFAYMPYQEGTGSSIAISTDADSNTDTYTLSVPYAPSTSSSNSPFLIDAKNAPIICALPEHRTVKSDQDEKLSFEHTVKFKFDQTLIGYKLLFKLDPTMGAIRQFHIKSVNITGEIPISGTITRAFTYSTNTKKWTAGKIIWKDIATRTYTKDAPVSIPYQNTSSSENQSSPSLEISSTEYQSWGDIFYTIPLATFQPSINVTYDVKMTTQDGKTLITRENVTSSILLNKDNFSNINTGSTATINSIRILIQPRYLYVMSDQDAYTGYLLID
ncbi:fimbrillin family protein [Segatella copri]|uniref:fimbrillin family protein n=1 Tax=Segatella copri TaxID=165179 RepID=UPI001C473587|nr:fimbrillin family protein [Segatella copri]WOZ85406.1 fimbrillin family protein [Segatella copri]